MKVSKRSRRCNAIEHRPIRAVAARSDAWHAALSGALMTRERLADRIETMDRAEGYRDPIAVVRRRLTRLLRAGHAPGLIVECLLPTTLAIGVVRDFGRTEIVVRTYNGGRAEQSWRLRMSACHHRQGAQAGHQKNAAADDDESATAFLGPFVHRQRSRRRCLRASRRRDGAVSADSRCLTHGPTRSTKVLQVARC